MTSRVSELEARRRLLVAESALQRNSMRVDAARVGGTLQRVDRSVAAVRRLARNPWVLGAGALALFMLRRYPVVSLALRGVALASTARRALGTLERLAAEPAASDRGPR